MNESPSKAMRNAARGVLQGCRRPPQTLVVDLDPAFPFELALTLRPGRREAPVVGLSVIGLPIAPLDLVRTHERRGRM